MSTQTSTTAQDYIESQVALEAEAREALPYQFDTCTQPLGPLRQSVFACLTCTPPPASPAQIFTPAGVCYSCSISCHGEHNLVELFTKRAFTCDCGTERYANAGSGAECSLRLNVGTGRKGGVKGEKEALGNRYNQNFEGTFCGCGEEYDPEMEKGTMFQCLGLGTVEDGGCGEDWWHPECLMGLPRTKHEVKAKAPSESAGGLETVAEEGEDGPADTTHDEEPLPVGFPDEDDFDHVLCYKCTEAFPWIKQYAGTAGFLPAVPADDSSVSAATQPIVEESELHDSAESKKRKVEDDADGESQESAKRLKADSPQNAPTTASSTTAATVESTDQPKLSTLPPTETNGHPKPKHTLLPPTPPGPQTLFLTPTFREQLCHCPTCFPHLTPHPHLLEEEETHEPPVSESDGPAGGGSVHSGSIYERGEAALQGIDRVRAIEGAMVYNSLKEKVQSFLKPFAESGTAVGAEDIKEYFAKLRGDEEAGREAGLVGVGGGVEGSGRREQGGY